MRVISLVTEGIERAAEAGCLEWLFAQDADIICLQDTHCAEHTLKGNAFFPEGYHPYFLDHYDDPRRKRCRDLLSHTTKSHYLGSGIRRL